VLITNVIKAQQMTDLYEFAINDYYNELRLKGYIAKQDTMYITCGFCGCPNQCFDYDIELQNKKISYGIPDINKNQSEFIFHRLYSPDINNQFIIIRISDYVMTGDEIIYSGTTEYSFEYDGKEEKYAYVTKKNYGL
jgi:hypothetical protein